MIAVDTPYLPLLFGHPAKYPDDPLTGKPIEDLQGRIDLLIEKLEKEKETILIPQPAFSEFLVYVDQDGPKYITKIERSSLYKWGDFDLKAAVELAAIRLKDLRGMSGKAIKRITPAETAAKISFDRQIVAIAKAHRVRTIYSNDEGVKHFAEKLGIRVVRMWELPRPQTDEQLKMFDPLESPGTEASDIAKVANEGDLSENGS
jgi:predicted nucleic acid-binding protein